MKELVLDYPAQPRFELSEASENPSPTEGWLLNLSLPAHMNRDPKYKFIMLKASMK
jgi:hypothetical protein